MLKNLALMNSTMLCLKLNGKLLYVLNVFWFFFLFNFFLPRYIPTSPSLSLSYFFYSIYSPTHMPLSLSLSLSISLSKGGHMINNRTIYIVNPSMVRLIFTLSTRDLKLDILSPEVTSIKVL